MKKLTKAKENSLLKFKRAIARTYLNAYGMWECDTKENKSYITNAHVMTLFKGTFEDKPLNDTNKKSFERILSIECDSPKVRWKTKDLLNILKVFRVKGYKKSEINLDLENQNVGREYKSGSCLRFLYLYSVIKLIEEFKDEDVFISENDKVVKIESETFTTVIAKIKY